MTNRFTDRLNFLGSFIGNVDIKFLFKLHDQLDGVERVCSEVIDMSDVVQDVLVEANRRLQRYLETPVMPFHLWLRQIAKDRIIDARRRHRVSAKRSVDREQQLFSPRGHDQSSIQLASLLGDKKITPAAAALQKELAKRIENSISQLEEKDSEIIIMRHYEHLTNQEISKILNLSEPAASMRYLRAIRRLREFMQPEQLSQV